VDQDEYAGAQTGRSALFGYAVLRANFDHGAPSYLDNFSAFVVDALAECYPAAGDEAGIGEAIRATFGLTIPDRVVGRLLKKLARTGKIIEIDGEGYQLSATAQAGLQSLRENMTKFQASQMELLTKFTTFVKEHHSESVGLIDTDPASHLQAFIERHAAPLLRRGVSGDRGIASPWTELHGADYLIGSFMLYLEANDAATFNYLIDAVKGAILLGVLQMGPGDIHRKLDRLTIVLDTPVLLSALGYQGSIPQRAAEQVLGLARQLGVRLVCFDHSIKELDRVLDAAIAQLRSPRAVESFRHAVYLHFLDSGLTPSDIAIERATLNRELESLGIQVIPIPDNYYKYGLDETALEALLKEVLPTQRETTRLYDLQSLSAIHRMRKGTSLGSFEQCGYVLATDNYGLSVVGRRVDERHQWPLAMLDSEVASLLWVRSPAVADDLPRQQLVAAVYTAIQPTAHLWMKYVEEIERLEQRGQVNADEAVILRSVPEAREALMDVTLGESNKINPGSVEEIVERVRGNLSSPYKIEADDARAERDRAAQDADFARKQGQMLGASLDSLKVKLDALQKEEVARANRIKLRAQRRAHNRVLTCVAAISLLLITPEIVSILHPSAVGHLPAALRIPFGLAGAALVALTSIQVFFGAVRDWFRPIERWLAQRIERRMRLAAGLAEVGASEDTTQPEAE